MKMFSIAEILHTKQDFQFKIHREVYQRHSPTNFGSVQQRFINNPAFTYKLRGDGHFRYSEEHRGSIVGGTVDKTLFVCRSKDPLAVLPLQL